MAPLRSSRSTRNQDHQAASRSRGTVELDPTEGLPVQKWEQMVIKVNQDPSADPNAIHGAATGASATSSAEWSAQFGTNQYPWPEAPLPSFFTQLPSWNQEMLRRARISNTKPKLSEWDRKTHTWLSAAEIEKRQSSAKSEHLKNGDASTNNNGNSNAVDENVEQEEDDEHEEQAEDDMEIDNEEENGIQTRNVPSAKRRKQLAPEERTFEAKRWIQIPLAVAEKTEERKFLADRRPGMPSLYGGQYQNQVFMPLGLSQSGYTAYGTSNASYDLGDGTGLGTAVTQDQGAPAPIRRNIPPKRKKKKGGPGRRKTHAGAGGAISTPQIVAAGTTGLDAAAATVPASGAAEPAQDNDIAMQDGEEEGSDSGESEGDGSEEGEIDEGNKNNPAETSSAAMTMPMVEIGSGNVQTNEPKADPIVTAEITQTTAQIPTEIQPVEGSVPLPLPAEVDTTAVPIAPIEPSPMEQVMASAPSDAILMTEALVPEHPILSVVTEESEILPSTVEAGPNVGMDESNAVDEPPATEPISVDQAHDEVAAVPVLAIINPVSEESEPVTGLTDEPQLEPSGVATGSDSLAHETSPPVFTPAKDQTPPPVLEESIQHQASDVPEPAPAVAPSSPGDAAAKASADPSPQDIGHSLSVSTSHAVSSGAASEEHDLLGELENQLDKDMAG